MRRLVIIAICLFFSGCSLLPQKGTPQTPLELRGVLQGTTVVGGYVIITADLLVPVGSTLIIKAGTTLLVRNSESTKIDPEYLSSQTEILIRGSLIVDGRDDAKISFMPETPVAAGEVAWAGIILDGATDSVIRHADILQPETGILLINSSPEISSNRISKGRYGIVIQGGTAKVLDNEITGGEGGIFCWNQARPYLKDNLVVANEEEGIAVDRSSKPYIDRNTVSGNGIGLIVPSHVPYDPTMIAGNGENIRLLAARQEEVK